MEFRIAIQHIDAAVKQVINFLEDYADVYDLKEADIVNNTGEKIGEVYLLCCRASECDYAKIKDKYYTTEIEYEGFKTLM